MKQQKNIFNYFFNSLLLILVLNPLTGQEGRVKGLRIGYDLSRIALPLVDSTRKAFEISADFEVKPFYYAIAEYGQQKVHFNNEFYEYASDGSYFRIGFDYNFLGEKLSVDQYEMVFGGLRYGFATYEHHADHLYVPDNYWGDVSIENYGPMQLQAHWFEIAGGIRGELFRNIFIGWSFRARLMMFQNKDEIMYPYYIPGFGSGNRKTTIGFNYYIYYKIPIYTVKAKQ